MCRRGYCSPAGSTPASRNTSNVRDISSTHLCRPLVPRTNDQTLATTDRARAPQVRHTSPIHLRESLHLFQSFPCPSPPPSGISIGRVFRRIDRIPTVVQPVGLTVELSSTTHGPTPAKTWTGRSPGRTLLNAPQGLRRRHPR